MSAFYTATVYGEKSFKSVYKKHIDFIKEAIENASEKGKYDCNIKFPATNLMKMFAAMLIESDFKTSVVDNKKNILNVSWKHHEKYKVEDFNEEIISKTE